MKLNYYRAKVSSVGESRRVKVESGIAAFDREVPPLFDGVLKLPVPQVGDLVMVFLADELNQVEYYIPVDYTFSNLTDNTEDFQLENTQGNIGVDALGDFNVATGGAINLDVTEGFLATTGEDIVLEANGDGLVTAGGKIVLNASEVRVGAGATESMILGDTLVTLLGQLIDALAAETHSSPVGPTSPPLNAAAYISIKAQLATAKATIGKVK